eukprot:COSAG05_NODE_49_length_24373_cov_16.162561_8_plen_177_part_00
MDVDPRAQWWLVDKGRRGGCGFLPAKAMRLLDTPATAAGAAGTEATGGATVGGGGAVTSQPQGEAALRGDSTAANPVAKAAADQSEISGDAADTPSAATSADLESSTPITGSEPEAGGFNSLPYPPCTIYGLGKNHRSQRGGAASEEVVAVPVALPDGIPCHHAVLQVPRVAALRA